jgi:tetratricopeptide (TPR) repeat protein
LVAGGGAIYAPFHKPEALAKPYAMLRRHECSVADSEFSGFLVTTPNDARAISGKADALVCLDKYDDAIANYSRAIELDPKWFHYFGRGIAFNRYGWALATSPISAYRDGPTAILYATHACDLTSWKDANPLDTLAAAYAEAGQFGQAVKWQASALELGGNVDRDDFEARLAMYRRREPYRSRSDTPIYF